MSNEVYLLINKMRIRNFIFKNVKNYKGSDYEKSGA